MEVEESHYGQPQVSIPVRDFEVWLYAAAPSDVVHCHISREVVGQPVSRKRLVCFETLY